MNRDIELNEDLKKKLINKKVVKNRIKFGYGNLMPVYSIGKEEVDMIITKHEGFREVGVITPAEEGVELADNAKPLFMLSFPKNETGLKSINALRDWLDNLERLIKEDD